MGSLFVRQTVSFFIVAAIFVAPATADTTSTCMQAFRANQSANSYYAVWTRNYGGTVQTSTIEMQKPDRFHETGQGHEMVAIGDKSWMRSGNGSWQQLPYKFNAAEIVSMDPSSFKNFHGTRTCTDSGMGLWHGQPAHIYRSTYVDPKLGTSKSVIYVMGDGFVHHMDYTTPRGTASMDFSRFNTVTVNSP